MPEKNAPPVIDFTDTEEFGALEPGLYLLGIDKADYGQSGSGASKIRLECIVMDPEGIKGRIFENINLQHKNTKGRFLNILAALGDWGSKADMKGNKKFAPPPTAELLGRQFGARTQIRPGEGEYNDQAVIQRVMSETAYWEEKERTTAV